MVNSCSVVFDHDLAADLNLPPQWQHQANLFKAVYADDGELPRRCVAQKYGSYQLGH